ncbi:MAG: DUF4124 domain-containing protein [Nitrospinae bacterium]|nr:DUF4124 domain-containing protein [Nitrospinota bacterium]
MSSPVFSETFKWVDKGGKTYFTDDFLKVPSEYRNQVERRNGSGPVMEKKETPKTEKAKTASQPRENAQAKPSEEKNAMKEEEKVSVLDKIIPAVDDNGNAVFSGRIKNNSKEILSSVEIIFTVEDPQGKALEIVGSSVDGELKGTLKGGETGFFIVRSNAPINSMGAFKYNVKWKSFGK